MAKSKQATPRFERASTNPDAFVQGGLPDNFVAEVTDVFWTISNFNGYAKNRNKRSEFFGEPIYKFVLRVILEPDEDEEVGEVHPIDYSAGSLLQHIPIDEDGEPVGATLEMFQQLGESANQLEFDQEDIEAIRGAFPGSIQGKELPKGSNFHWIREQLNVLGVPESGDISADLLGRKFRWNRVVPSGPGFDRSGFVRDDGQAATVSEVLTPTEVVEVAKKGGKGVAGKKAAAKGAASKVSAKARAAAEEEEEEGGEDDALAAQIEEAIVDALSEAKGTSLNQAAVPKVILAAFKGDKNLKAALDLWKSEGWRGDEDRAWSFDADTGVLSL